MSDANASPLARWIGDRPFVDGHNDLPFRLRERFGSDPEALDLTDTTTLEPALHTDWTRMREGGVNGQFWVAYLPTEEAGAGAGRAMLEQVDLIRRMVAAWPEHLGLARSADDVERIHGEGRIASLVALEGGHGIESSLAVLRAARARGARYLTLTHNDHCEWADSATADPRHRGLTGFGREVVAELNRLGMMVDLSHTAPSTMRDAIETSKAPVVFTHSGARAVTDHPRNVPDDVLERVAESGGIVMATFVPRFVSDPVREHHARRAGEEARARTRWPADPDRRERALAAWDRENPAPVADIRDVADHLDHLAAVMGHEHVGIGSDFDGIPDGPEGLEHVGRFPALFEELADRGWNEDRLGALASGNLLRVMREAERIEERPGD